MRTIHYKQHKIVTHKANRPDPPRASVYAWRGDGSLLYVASSTADAKAWVDSKVDQPIEVSK